MRLAGLVPDDRARGAEISGWCTANLTCSPAVPGHLVVMATRLSAPSATSSPGAGAPQLALSLLHRGISARIDGPSRAAVQGPIGERGTLGDAACRGQPPTLSPGRQVVARPPFPGGLAACFPRADTGGRTVAFPLLIRTGVASPAPDERRHPVRRRRPGQPHRVRGVLARAPSPLERAPEYTGVSRPCREEVGGARPSVTGSERRPGAG
jgi:hypothetical protein